MCTAQVQEAKYSLDERAKQYKRNKLDDMSRDAQAKIGEQSGGLYRTSTQALDKLQDFSEDVGDFFNPKGASQEQSDTVSANYSKSSSEKSSKTDKKGKTESKGGTGGSKRQFYA